MNKNESKYFNTARIMDESLLSLLSYKEYEYLTIKEICHKAGVNRSTFYLHYDNINDLLEETIEYISNKFYDSFNNESLDINKIKLSNNKEEGLLLTDKYLIPYLEFVKENKIIFKLNFKYPNLFKSDSYLKYLYKTYFKELMDYYKVEEKIQPYVISYYLKGITSIIEIWINNDCKEEINEIIKIIKWCTRINEREIFKD